MSSFAAQSLAGHGWHHGRPWFEFEIKITKQLEWHVDNLEWFVSNIEKVRLKILISHQFCSLLAHLFWFQLLLSIWKWRSDIDKSWDIGEWNDEDPASCVLLARLSRDRQVGIQWLHASSSGCVCPSPVPVVHLHWTKSEAMPCHAASEHTDHSCSTWCRASDDRGCVRVFGQQGGGSMKQETEAR